MINDRNIEKHDMFNSNIIFALIVFMDFNLEKTSVLDEILRNISK